MAKRPSDVEDESHDKLPPLERLSRDEEDEEDDRRQITITIPPRRVILTVIGIVVLTVVAVLVVQSLTDEDSSPSPDATLEALQAQATQLGIGVQTQTAAAQIPTPIPTAEVLVVTATSEPQVIVVTNTPVPSPQVIVVTATPPQSSGFTRSQVDGVVGSGNWECFPDRLDGIAIRITSEGFVVTHPLSAVDKEGVKYIRGQSVPGVGSATAWLAGSLASRNECPQSQPTDGGAMISLIYDRGDTNCRNRNNDPDDPLIAGQETYVAYFLCQAMDAGTETAMRDAVRSIQQMALQTGAKVWMGTSVTIPQGQAALVWCPNTTEVVAPSEVDFPLDLNRSTEVEYDSPYGLGNIFVLQPLSESSTARTFSGCPEEFWAVAVY